ncbi:MAG: VOC family protein [Carbonactinosporaceae bacterium]
MSEVSAYPEGTPCWVDLGADDREAAMKFYGGLFGWEFEVGPQETGHYTTCLLRGLSVAGIGERPRADDGTPLAPVAWTTFLACVDADAAAARSAQAGGTVVMGPMDILDQGRLAVVEDPTGAVFGMWEPRKHSGARVVNEPGSLCWNEVATRDHEAAAAFYRAVFGYELAPMEMPGLAYSTLKVAGRSVAGILRMDASWPDDVPPHWMTYFDVADADVTVPAVRDLGGEVIRGPHDSPYGRLAVISDPQGAVFSIIELTD